MGRSAAFELGSPPLVVGRAPLLPVELARRVLDAADPLTELRTVVEEQPLILQGVQVASPSLYAAARAWCAGEAPRNARAPLRLLAYVLRMTTRPTPLGLFAGVGSVAAGPATTLVLDSLAGARTMTRPDTSWLAHVIARVEGDPACRERLLLFANEAVVERGGRLHVLHADRMPRAEARGAFAEFVPVSLRYTAAVARVREWCRDGATFATMRAALAREFDLDDDRADRMLTSLWNAGVFVSSLRPSTTGDPWRHLRETVTAAAPELGAQLAEAARELETLDALPLADRTTADYARADAALRTCEPGLATVVHLDTSVPFEGALGAPLLAEVERYAALLARSAKRYSLDAYRRRFIERYESAERLVPLLELVDADFGIGPPPPLAPDAVAPNNARDGYLFALATAAAIAGVTEIELDAVDLERLIPSGAPDALVADFEIGVQIASRSRDDLEAGDYLICPGAIVASPGAGKSSGRFGSLLPDSLVAELRTRLSRRTADRSAVAADLVYFPQETRSTNVMVRPPMAPCELQVGVHAPCAPRERLDPSDLFVCIDDDRFVLVSRRLGKAVNVRELHRLNTPATAQPVVRFLSALDVDGKHVLVSFDWGTAAALPFLPRVRHGRLVLARARWLADPAMFREAPAERARRVAEWRARHHVPRFVCAIDEDRRIVVDLESATGLEVLADQLPAGRAEPIVLEEMLPALDQCWLMRDGQHYASEFTFSFFERTASPPSPPSPPQVATERRWSFPNGDRAQAPAGAWTYVKLYCGAREMDFLLRDRVAPLLARLRTQDAIDRWHFVRFADPGPHLRVRVRAAGGERDIAPEALAAIFESLRDAVRTGALRRTALDTYEREIERYGGPNGMDAAELLFTLDSERALAALQTRRSNRLERALAAVAAADPLVRGLFPRSDLGTWLEATRPEHPKLDPPSWAAVKRLRAEITNPTADEWWHDATTAMRALAGDGALTRPLIEIARSLVHMHYNRYGLDALEEDLAWKLQWHAYYGVLRAP